jgi:hypothetical protein
MVPLDNLNFDDVHVITDDNQSDLPTKENIVSHPCEILLLPSDFYSVGSDEGIS